MLPKITHGLAQESVGLVHVLYTLVHAAPHNNKQAQNLLLSENICVGDSKFCKVFLIVSSTLFHQRGEGVRLGLLILPVPGIYWSQCHLHRRYVTILPPSTTAACPHFPLGIALVNLTGFPLCISAPGAFGSTVRDWLYEL